MFCIRMCIQELIVESCGPSVQTRVAELEERVEKQREVLTETENQWHGQVEALEQRDRISSQVSIRKRIFYACEHPCCLPECV